MPALRTRSAHPPARPLDLVAASAPPPALAIVAPTPRTFTFPTVHNLSDSPYASPSNSPFEEASLRALSTSAPSSLASTPVSSHRRTPPPLSSFTRTLWPDSVFASPSPAPGSSPRRPKKGDDDYVKRPENAFILFRRMWSKDQRDASPSSPASHSPGGPPQKKPRQADLSKTISQKWKTLPPEERAYWEELAREKKREHEMRHPDYVYRPQRRNKNNAGSTPTPTPAPAPPPQQLEFVLPVGPSAGGAEEDPTSLMPIISRLGVGNGRGGFDYLPSGPGQFETSEFLKSLMYPAPITTSGPRSAPLFSPASSASGGSAPPSPHTPPSAFLPTTSSSSPSFHPSVFSASTPSPTNADLVLEPKPANEPELATFTSCASLWGNTSPWDVPHQYHQQPNLAAGDFDLASIPPVMDAGEWDALGVFELSDADAAAHAGGVEKGVGEIQLSELPFGQFDIDIGAAMDFDELINDVHGQQDFGSFDT
ncbi:hypothetical protein FB45DRAFT_1121579 [Roridomyces roridus]|uniref:HMG box domain-containing protein n=1 Tax=Roridomyces roridus TaxID=1738132 RepID=A0AAD7F9H1_9AGAR|nr:hypothetical protein FB45DRAFT_1121579 [Roridomyces roridus]